MIMSTMSIIEIRTRTYATAIYKGGTNRLTARTETVNGEEKTFAGVASGYYTPVEQYAVNNFTQYEIDNALAQGYINQQEYDETIAFMSVI